LEIAGILYVFLFQFLYEFLEKLEEMKADKDMMKTELDQVSR